MAETIIAGTITGEKIATIGPRKSPMMVPNVICPVRTKISFCRRDSSKVKINPEPLPMREEPDITDSKGR